MIDKQKQIVNHNRKKLKNLVLDFFVVFLFVMKFKCPVYRGNFVLKWAFLGRISVRFKEGPVYECPVYRGKINKKNFLVKLNFQNCPA